jgi:S-adenosylmethionine-diacylgycerolhomoserine-N-methlytransferase
LAHPGAPPGATAAEHMDAIYRYQRFIYDASRKYYLLGRDRLIEELKPPPGGRVLEVACGTGRNLVKAARRYPDATFYGFDISTAMLDTALGTITRHKLADRVIVATGDATDFSGERLFGVPAFDRVFVSYSLSMIPPWRAALRQAFAAVAPGGRLHIVDFGEQAGLPRWFRTGLRAWLAKFSVEPRAELESELAALAAETGARLEFERLLRDYAQRVVLVKP